MKLCYLHEQTDGVMHDSTGSLVRFYLRWNSGKEQWQIGLYSGASMEGALLHAEEWSTQ